MALKDDEIRGAHAANMKLRRLIEERGSVAAFATYHRLNHARVYDVRNLRRPFYPALLKAIGMRRVILIEEA